MVKNTLSKKVGNATAMVFDGLSNLLTGMGIEGIDKSMSSRFEETMLDYRELEDAYSSDWLSGKVVKLPPFDMTREWRTMSGDMKPKNLEAFLFLEKKLKVKSKFKEVMTWARLYGGAGIILNIDDGLDPSEPIELDRIKKNSLKSILVKDRQFLHMNAIDNDPLSENYGYPKTYRLSPTSINIHNSRIIRFDGLEIPIQARRRNQLWGKSVIENIYTALIRASEVQENIGALIHEATVDVIRIPDLMAILADPEDEAALKKRFGTAKIMKSVHRMMLMSTEEEYEPHSQPFTGLVDIIEKFLNIVAGAADIPITRLFGQSPGGQSSTGESDLKNYYDGLSSQQNVDVSPKLNFIDEIIYRSATGEEPPEMSTLDFKWNPLWQMSEEEKSDLELKRSQRDETYLNSGVINEKIIAQDLMEHRVYSGVDAEYVEEMEKIVNEMENDENQEVDENIDESEEILTGE